MVNTSVIAKVYELKEKLINSDEYKIVKEKESIMEDKCAILFIKYNNIFNEYKEALRFEKYGSDVSKVQKELALVKKEIDDNSYVKEYRLAYKKMRKLLNMLETTLFENLINKKYIEID